MNVLIVFLLSIFSSQIFASDLSECGDYFLVGEVVQNEKDEVQFLINKGSMSQFKLDVKKTETIVSLLALENQPIKVKSRIERRVANYTGELGDLEEIKVLLPPQYKIANSIELVTKKECKKE